MIQELKSVKRVIDTETLFTYPMVNGEYVLQEEDKIHVDCFSIHWFDKLSDRDFDTISLLMNERIKSLGNVIKNQL